MRKCIQKIFFFSALSILMLHTLIPHSHSVLTQITTISNQDDSSDNKGLLFELQQFVSQDVGSHHLNNFSVEHKLNYYFVLDVIPVHYLRSTTFVECILQPKYHYECSSLEPPTLRLKSLRAPPFFA